MFQIPHKLKKFSLLLAAIFSYQVAIISQVVYDNSSSNKAISSDSVIVSHLVGSGNSRLLLVGVSTRNRDILNLPAVGAEASDVTFAGDPLIYLGTEGSNTDAETFIFMGIDPPSGTNSAVVKFTNNLGNNNAGIVGVSSFSNVDLTNPVGTFTSAAGNNTAPSLTMASTTTNHFVFQVLAATDASTTVTLNSGQTQRWLFSNADRPTGAGYTRLGLAGSTTLSYTLNASQRWSLSGVIINALPTSDLSITKTVNNSTPYKGQTITFTLTALNTGVSVDLIQVDDILPSGYDYVSHSTATGSYNAGTGVWDIGTLNSGVPAILTINAVVLGTGTYLNSATISGNVNDSDPTNDTRTRSITICQAGGNQPLFGN